jgi:hypothetical protein
MGERAAAAMSRWLGRYNASLHIRCHHLLKEFWGWRDKQVADGTVIWTLPGDQTYVTTPGSALLFPGLDAV